MAAYARRHYGIDDYRLREPRVIVQHYTVTDSFQPVYDTFAVDRPDPELGELPGVCAHYVIDRDGTIYRWSPPGSCAGTPWGSTTRRSASSTWGAATARCSPTGARSPPRCG